MDQLLHLFNSDEHTKEAFRAFVHLHIDAEALSLLKKRGDAAHIADAAELIDGAFEALKLKYGPKPTKRKKDGIDPNSPR